jgi:hypothetical protein
VLIPGGLRSGSPAGLSSAEGLICEVRDEADKRLMVMQGEFAAVLRIMSREGNNLSPVLRSAWTAKTCEQW